MKNFIFAVILLVAHSALYAQAPPVPAEYQDLYAELETSISDFEQTVDASWDGTRHPVAFSAELKSAHANLGPLLLSPYHYFGVLIELDSLKALGVKAVTMSTLFPVLYSGFYEDPAEYQQYVDFYSRLADDIRARGLQVIAKTGMVFSQGGVTLLDVGPFYDSLTLDQYERGRMEVARTIALSLRPDYLSVIHEPDTEAAQSGKPELRTVEGSAHMLGVILDGLWEAGAGDIPTGAGVGSWTPSYASFVEEFASSRVDFIDVHVYPVNMDYLPRVLEIADMAGSYGKKLAISEAWPSKIRDSELLGLPAGQAFARDLLSFWQPLDGRFLAALVKLAHYKKLEFFSVPWTERFYSYLDYDDTLEWGQQQIFAEGQARVYQQLTAGQYTPTALDYRDAILETPDEAPPTAPPGIWAVTVPAGINVLWQLSEDDVGVAGYNVYRDDTPVGTTASFYYLERNLAPAETHTYWVEAYDASGNVSASSDAVTGSAPRGLDVTPPSVPADLAGVAISRTWIRIFWTPSEDDVAVAGYNILRGASPDALSQVATTYGSQQFDGGLDFATTYYYAVEAFDREGNVSAPSGTISVRTKGQ